MEVLKKHVKDNYHYIISALAVGGIAFAAFNSTNSPLFNNLDQFVIFAQEEIKLEQGVQVSSGDLGSNGKIDIEKDAIINGNLFADKITLDKNTIISGSVSFNKLETKKESQILGTQTKPVSLPIANLPEIPEFLIGTQDFKFEGKNNTLPAGNYRNVTLEKNSKLILAGGTYNINKLELKENSDLIFSAPTTLNIKKELKGQQHIAILQGNNNLKPTDLVVNYQGKEEKAEEKSEGSKPIEFDKDSFLNFRLLAPKASVHIGEHSTIRGQILTRKVKMGKDGVVSRQTTFSKESNPDKIVTDNSGDKIIVNEIVLVLSQDATLSDAERIAAVANGRITAIVSSINLYKIEVNATTVAELNNLIKHIQNLNDPKVEIITTNNVVDLF